MKYYYYIIILFLCSCSTENDVFKVKINSDSQILNKKSNISFEIFLNDKLYNGEWIDSTHVISFIVCYFSRCSRYAWANLFILPGTILFCFLGATAGSLADSGASGDSGIITIVTIVVGIVFGVLAIVVVSFYAKKELNKVSELIHVGLANDIYLGGT